jgi:DNA-binding MarR family transcriptional regulator
VTAAHRRNPKQVAQTGEARSGDVDDFVTALLAASRVLVGVAARSLTEIEDTVTVTQFRTLVVLDGHRDGVNLNGLAEQLDVATSTAARMVDRLLVAGLVTRQENPTNRREVLLGLTPDGRRVVRTVTTRRRKQIARIVKSMPTERRSELLEALAAFAAAAGEANPDPAITHLGW